MNDSPECFVERYPVARKSHRCCECHGRIERSEKYQRSSGIWDGDPMRFKTCFECAQIRSEIKPLDHWDVVCFEQLREWLTEGSYPELLSRFKANKEKRKIVLTESPAVLPSSHERDGRQPAQCSELPT